MNKLLDFVTVSLSHINPICFTQYQVKKYSFYRELPESTLAYSQVKDWASQNMPVTYAFLLNTPRRFDEFLWSLVSVIQCNANGQIQKVRYGELKDNLNSVVGGLFTMLGRNKLPLFGESTMVVSEFDLVSWNSPSSLHELVSAKKRFGKALDGAQSELIAEIYEAILEWDQIIELNNDLKAKQVVKSNEPKVEVLQSDQRICAYCFRAIRLQNGVSGSIAYHGFTRGHDVIGGSCDGAFYKPFEESCEGTFKHLNNLNIQKEQLKNNIVQLHEQIEKAEAGQLVTGRDLFRLKSNLRSMSGALAVGIPSTQRFLLSKLQKAYPERVNDAEAIIANDVSTAP